MDVDFAWEAPAEVGKAAARKFGGFGGSLWWWVVFVGFVIVASEGLMASG